MTEPMWAMSLEKLRKLIDVHILPAHSGVSDAIRSLHLCHGRIRKGWTDGSSVNVQFRSVFGCKTTMLCESIGKPSWHSLHESLTSSLAQPFGWMIVPSYLNWNICSRVLPSIWILFDASCKVVKNLYFDVFICRPTTMASYTIRSRIGRTVAGFYPRATISPASSRSMTPPTWPSSIRHKITVGTTHYPVCSIVEWNQWKRKTGVNGKFCKFFAIGLC